MFDEIFKRWINMEQLTENDVVSLFLEWNQTFGDGKGTAREVVALMNLVHTNYGRLASRILHDIGIKKGYKWEEVYDVNSGRLIARFLVDKI